MTTCAFVQPSPVAPRWRTRALVQDVHRVPVRPGVRARRRVLVPRAAQSLESYRALEGFGESDSAYPFLPNSIIYSSLRRRAERMCMDAALDLFKELASKGIVSQPSSVLPSKALSPRDVVDAVLGSVRKRDAQAVLQFASDKNPFKASTSRGLFAWLETNEDFSFLLNMTSFFIAPQGRTFGPEGRSCIVSCVINTTSNTKHAVSFNLTRDVKTETWQVDSIFLG